MKAPLERSNQLVSIPLPTFEFGRLTKGFSMHRFARFRFASLALLTLSSFASGQGIEPPLDDKRLSIHTLIREDIFSGWRANNQKRLKRGEENLEKLLKLRPKAKGDLLAWKGGVALYHATVAIEKEQSAVYEEKLAEARQLFEDAKKAAPRSGGVHSLIGGSSAFFGDRLATKDQKVTWAQAYDSYQTLWKGQGPNIDRMPLHIGGELLAGLAQTSLRTGRKEEALKHLDKIIELYGGSTYAKEAKIWKEDPKGALTRNITCNSCHSSGRLRAKLKRLDAE